MSAAHKNAALALGVGTSALFAATALPAAADDAWPKKFQNNGCEYAGEAGTTHGETLAQVWNSDGNKPCAAGWVQLHYRDSKGATKVKSDKTGWNPNGGAATVVSAGKGGKFRYACFAAKSKSHGNWSEVRRIGSGSGGCGHP